MRRLWFEAKGSHRGWWVHSTWAPPNAAEAISDLDRARIVESIRETFPLQGFEIDVI